MFSKVSIATLTAVVLISAGPALADGKNNSDPSGASAKSQPAPKAKTRYCIKTEAVTGSIMSGRVCQTAAEWLEDGVDVTKLKTGS